MTTTITTTISIQKTLFDQAELLAQQLNISKTHLFGIAIEDFIKNYQEQTLLDEFNNIQEDQLESNEQLKPSDHAAEISVPKVDRSRVINQGDIFWIRLDNPGEGELGYHPHPYVVIQDNLFNHSRINTAVVCALTSNLKQATAPGNVLLDMGEANLPKHSAVVVSKISTVDKSRLGEHIGTLNKQRINQILAGMQFLQTSFFAR